MKPNVELLRRTIAHIEAHPHEWSQSMWRNEGLCGTSYCFAGWAVTLHGAKFAMNDGRPNQYFVVPPGADPADQKQWREIAPYAAEILGIPVPDPDHYCYEECPDDCDLPELFRGDNSLHELRHIVGELCEEAGR